jgi:hypothetical protein
LRHGSFAPVTFHAMMAAFALADVPDIVSDWVHPNTTLATRGHRVRIGSSARFLDACPAGS